ncbi:flagellar capping protein [compost metagenome]
MKISGTETISLSQLGITTGSYETRGKLVLDTDKLKTAIQNDPDIVNKFLGNNYAASSLGGDYKDTDGILSRVRKISNQSLANLADTAGTSKVSTDLNAAFNTDSTIGNQLYNLNRRISDLESRLNDKEANYYKKFATMESAINKYNTISSSLLSYLS